MGPIWVCTLVSRGAGALLLEGHWALWHLLLWSPILWGRIFLCSIWAYNLGHLCGERKDVALGKKTHRSSFGRIHCGKDLSFVPVFD